MEKTKIALFDLTGCEGCEFHLLSLNELLLDVFQDFEIVNWRLLTAEQQKDFDIAFIEGAATTNKHIKLLKQVRKTSEIVIALGACAITGNVFAEITPQQREKLAAKIYDKDYKLKAKFLDPVKKYIKVDYEIPGCPPDIEKFKELLSEFKNKKITSPIKDITPPDYVAKIEGHGSLKLNFQTRKVQFEVEESERLVEGLVLGKDFTKAPFINSRICGICPVAHNLCSWKAIENSLGLKISDEAVLLREIMMISQLVKSHLLHLFFLVLPDYAGVKSSMELSVKYPAEFHLMLNIKRVAEKALELVAGSTAFPINTTLAGFFNPPHIEDLLALKETIYDIFDEAEDLINLFSNLQVPKLETKIKMFSIKPDNNKYPLYSGKMIKPLKEVISTNSTAKLGVLPNGEVFKVGAMARMANYSAFLNVKALNYFQKVSPKLENPFNNNIAQTIEILHFLEELVKLIDVLGKKDLTKAKGIEKPKYTQKENRGEAYVEAPRGILYHQVVLDNKGAILNYNIIPPTQINLASLQQEAQNLVDVYSDFEPQILKLEVEKLIRAFDPCITCAVH
ncbi:nickel-dependent hydrogenase large subunit [Patescibacteria group bacterium]